MDKVLLAIERDEIKAWLHANDYKVNKVVIGEWQKENPKFIAYLEERKTRIERLNAILQLLQMPNNVNGQNQ